jgi:peptidoglycan/xylan/chitin deacetylase (PgdA/CDA1 family)
MARARLAAVSIDLDGPDLYRAIHGLHVAAPSGAATEPRADARGSSSFEASWLHYDRAIPRALAFAAERSLPLTLFAIGADAVRPESAALLRGAVAAGHAVENHSLSHRYDLVRLPPREMGLEVERSALALRLATGVAPTGFRAPGYTVSDALFDVLDDLGVAWDSSVFPSGAYWLAKAGVLARYAATGRPSASIVGSPLVALAPSAPYHPGRRWWCRGQRRLVELPIWTLPLGVPLIGTSLALVPAASARTLGRWAASRAEGLANLELHALDFLDASDPGLDRLAGHEPALRVPLAARLERFHAFLDGVAEAGLVPVTLREAAARVPNGAA